MNITVFGCGYVGLTTAVGLAEMGNRVIGIDRDEAKVRLLSAGKVPFFEPGMEEMLRRNLREGRLSFSNDGAYGVRSSRIVFCAVGTPPGKDNLADMKAVLEVAAVFGRYAGDGSIFINKSTVPVGATETIRETVLANSVKRPDVGKNASTWSAARGRVNAGVSAQNDALRLTVVSNPEFLREGSALNDFFKPDRVIIGMETPGLRVKKIIRSLYRPMTKNGVPIVFTDMRSAEVIKYASNAYLATRISFINELANFCEIAGADITKVAHGIGLDKRIGTGFLEAGIGFGGSCLPKDLVALLGTGKRYRFDFRLLAAVDSVNREQPGQLIRKFLRAFKTVRGLNIAVWGLSFKPGTDDLRDAPSLSIVRALLRRGVNVTVFDPAAIGNAKKIFGNSVKYSPNYYSVLRHADALFILTEWKEFRSPDYTKMREIMKQHYIFDGRNVLDPEVAVGNGFRYFGVGKAPLPTSPARVEELVADLPREGGGVGGRPPPRG